MSQKGQVDKEIKGERGVKYWMLESDPHISIEEVISEMVIGTPEGEG